MAAPRIAALTGIRAVAALAVCVTHAAYWTGHYTDDVTGRLWARFEVGVPIFFVLSGYLLFSPWVRALADGSPAPSLGRYLWHRARRILPAYWITVLAVYAIFLVYRPPDASPAGTGWSGLWRNLTLTQVYGAGHLHAGLTQMWSLAAEVLFYLVLPPIAWLLCTGVCRRRWEPGLLLIAMTPLLMVAPVYTALVAGDTGIDPTARLWAPAFFEWFAAGMMLAVFVRIRAWPSAWVSVPVAVAAFLASGSAVAGEPTIAPSTVSATVVKHLLYTVVALGLIGPLTRPGPRGWWARLCGSRPMLWCGEISYEFFLVHVMVLEAVMDVLGFRVFTGSLPAALAVTVAISVPVAWVLHRITAPLWRSPAPRVVAARRAGSGTAEDCLRYRGAHGDRR